MAATVPWADGTRSSHLGSALPALVVVLTLLLAVPPAGATGPALHGPFLITSDRGGVYRVEARFPHRSDRVLAARAYSQPHAAPTGRILFAKHTDLSGERMRVLVGGAGETQVLADAASHCVDELAISSDGTLATYTDNPGEGAACESADAVHLVTIDTGARLELPAPPRTNWFGAEPAFSRDGAYVSLLGRGQGAQLLWLYDTATGERVRELSGYRPTDLPTRDGAIVVRRHDDGEQSGTRCQLFTASPDGSTLAWIRRHHGQHIVLAPVGDVTDRRDLGTSRTGPGRPTPIWVSDRFLATQSPEEDERAVRRVSDGKPVSGPIPVFAGWTR